MKILQIHSQKKMCLYPDLNPDVTTHTVEHKALPDEYKKQRIYSKAALFDPLNWVNYLSSQCCLKAENPSGRTKRKITKLSLIRQQNRFFFYDTRSISSLGKYQTSTVWKDLFVQASSLESIPLQVRGKHTDICYEWAAKNKNMQGRKLH